MELIFEQYTDRLQRKLKRGEISPSTVSGFNTAAKRLSEWLGSVGETADAVSETLLEEYFDTLPLAPASRGTHLRHIQAAYNYAVKAGRLRRNPALDLASPKGGLREPKIISSAELREMKGGIQLDRDWVFFHLLAYTGMRRAEVLGLRWDDGGDSGSVLRLGEQTIRVFGKGRKTRYVPVHPALGDVLAEQSPRPGKTVVLSDSLQGCASETVQGMVRRMHPTFTPHDFRRTVASSLGRNGVADRHIDRILGWSKPDVRERYYMNVAEPELQRAILKLYADDPV
jgi:integrase